MRKIALYILLSVFVFCIAGNAKAQSDSLHIRFMSISTGEKFETFIEKLKQKGFRKVASEDPGMLNGKLFYDRVTICVTTTPVSDLVSYILVVFNTERTFEATHRKYLNYIGALSEKYGKPTDLSDKSSYTPLNKSYIDENDGLEKDNKTYITSWILPEGEITLDISEKFILSLTYYDRINMDIRKKEFKEIIDKEL